jgi:hypothetical protein
MKRILVTILSILYMASATGATVHIHYCMGKFMGVSLIHKDGDRCGKCGMKKAGQKMGCCKDEHKTFKTGDHQLAKASFDFSHQITPVHLTAYSFYPKPVYASCVNKTAQANAPPSYWRTCRIYIQVQNFRI